MSTTTDELYDNMRKMDRYATKIKDITDILKNTELKYFTIEAKKPGEDDHVRLYGLSRDEMHDFLQEKLKEYVPEFRKLLKNSMQKLNKYEKEQDVY